MTNNRYRVGYEWKNHRGQVYVMMPDDPNCTRQDGFVPRAKLVMSAKVGRTLRPEERVLHVDGNVENDDPDNLMLFENQKALQQYRSQKIQEERQGEQAGAYSAYIEKATRHRRATQEGVRKAQARKRGGGSRS